MNKVELVGRLTKEPELKLTQNQTQFCNITIACDRPFKNANGQREADFINCVAWRETANFIQKYFHKGNRIGVTGSIQTRSYDDNDGTRRFITEVVIDGAEFVESAQSTQPAPAPAPEPIPEPAQDAPVGELPFEI